MNFISLTQAGIVGMLSTCEKDYRQPRGSQGDLIISALGAKLSGLGSSPDRGQFHSTSLHSGI